MDTFEEALDALIDEWRDRFTPADEIAQALEAARLSIEDEIAEMDE
jgi:hypothetical protein